MNKIYSLLIGVLCLQTLYSHETIINQKSDWKKRSFLSNIHEKPKTITEEKQEMDETNNVFSNIQNPILGYLYVDCLYWGTKPVGFSYEMTNANWIYYLDFTPEHALIVGTTFSGKPQLIKTHWAPGFRINLGFSNIFDWMIDGVYTYYVNEFKHKEKNPPNTTNLADFFITSSKTSYKLYYWTGDIDFGTNFKMASTVIMTPFISLRAAHVHFQVHYSNENYDLIPLHTKMLFGADFENNPYIFNGAGPRLGFNMLYSFRDIDVDFWGSLSSALLYGKVKSSQTTFDTRALYVPLDSTKNLFKDLKASLQLLLGAELKKPFDDEEKSFILRANWETNYWWDLGDITPYKTLILFGFNFGIGFEY